MAVSNLSPYQQALSPLALNRLACVGFLRSSIRVLLAQCGPSDIARLVMTVVINAINGAIWGRLTPDVIYKLLKRAKSKFYSTAPVILIAYIVWVIASSFGVFVSPIFGSCAPFNGMAVAGSVVVSITETATAFGFAAGEIVPQDGSDVAAVANAFPKSAAFLVSSRKSNNGKPARFVTCDILSSSHAVRTSNTNGLVRFGRLLEQLTEPLRL